MTLRLQKQVELSHSITPDCCGTTFWVTAGQLLAWKRKHKTFYCPGCGSGRWYPPGESDLEKLERKVQEANQRTQRALARANEAEYRRRAEKAAKTRLKNRISKGVCPCCNRSFQNLQRHMASQHPGFTTAAQDAPEER